MVLNPPISNCATATGKDILVCTAALEAEYDTVLSQYQEAYANYVNLLTTNKSNLNRTLLEKPDSTWTPTPGTVSTLTTPSTTTTSALCNSVCATTSNCSAAVFNSAAIPPANKCQFYTGNGTITSDTTKTKTVYISIVAAKNIVDTLKIRLQSIIDELKTKTDTASLKSYIDGNNADYIVKKGELETKYNELVNDNIIVNHNLNKYNTTDNDFNQQKGFVKQQYLSYRFWTIFTIIIFIIVMKYILGIDSPSGNIMIWTTVIVLASFSLSKPSGFAMMGLILIILMLKTIKDYFTQNL